MLFNQIMIWVIAVGVLLGAGDRIIGNKFGLGKQFEEGFNAMGPLALGMVGIMSITPIIAKFVGPIIIPIFNLIGSDPAMFGSVLANDMGGYPLALELAKNHQMGLFSGLIVASMLGATIVFYIPVGLGMIDYEDRPFFAKGLLVGLISIPIGSVTGGMIAGFDFFLLLINTVPIVILSVLLALGLAYIPSVMIKGALLFGKLIIIIGTIGLAIASFDFLTGTSIQGIEPIMNSLKIVTQIGVVLLGIFPIVSLIIKIFNKWIGFMGRKIGINKASAAGLLVALANPIPVFKSIKNMDERGKVINMAFLVPACCALGDHLGFTAAVNKDMITAVVFGKIIAGVISVVIALWVTRDLTYEFDQSENKNHSNFMLETEGKRG